MDIRPTAHFQSFSGSGDEWNASLRNPRATHFAHCAGEVLPLVRKAGEAAKSGAWVAIALSYDSAPAFDSALRAKRTPDFPLAWCAIFDERATARTDPPEGRFPPAELSAAVTHEEYSAAVARIRSYIAAGDTYQVNFTYPLKLRVAGDDFGYFLAVAEAQGAGYSAYLDLGTHRILSFSPELFFSRRGDTIITRPMKGTAPRGRWAAEDDERAAALAASPKDRAENVMIVDLLRNDLGKIAAIGSVQVEDLFTVERINRVLQMTSTVVAKARACTTLAEVLSALFPCGSVTGAPKVRSMAIIEELERYPRGLYTGAIGLLSPGGDAVFNVAIRTLVADSRAECATFGVGGGITWDSTIEGEFEESALKASFLSAPPRRFELLETIALVDGEYRLLARHLSRMRESARYFGFRWDEPELLGVLRQLASEHPRGSWRTRLLASRSGRVKGEAAELPPARKAPLLVKLATSPIDDSDSLIYHKTTDRSRYDDELRSSQPCDDVIFWNSRGEITESSIANVVLRQGGRDWTPPREAGLLAGTFRAELIERGELSERTVTIAEIRSAGELLLINSVRGWMPARLAPQRIIGTGGHRS